MAGVYLFMMRPCLQRCSKQTTPHQFHYAFSLWLGIHTGQKQLYHPGAVISCKHGCTWTFPPGNTVLFTSFKQKLWAWVIYCMHNSWSEISVWSETRQKFFRGKKYLWSHWRKWWCFLEPFNNIKGRDW